MDRLNAKDLFYFEQDYFNALLDSKMLDAKLFLAMHNESKEIMAGAFCVSTKEIAHIELACSNELYMRNSPIRILFDECCTFYKKGNIKYLNLGGGSGGREGSLMKFKATFTQNYSEFNIWKWIVNQEIYNALLTSNQKDTNSNHFPKYRLQVI